MPDRSAPPLRPLSLHGGLKPAVLALAVATAFGALPPAARAQTLPSGGVAVHGQAVISQPAANHLHVLTQNGAGTGHSAINWQSFSISAGATATIQQPNAASLSINRVVTNTPSAIFGNLSSNGRLVLVNQSGIAVGAGAVIDTAGFTASALRMSDADALAGRLRFGEPGASMGGAAGLTVGGEITAREGDIVLVAPNIDLGAKALLKAPNGSTILAAGQQVEITGRGLEGITMLVQAPADQVRNLGRLEGSAVGVFAGTLRHSGEIQATTASLEGGRVVLKASGDALVEGAGTVIATGTQGGSVDVLGRRVAVMDQAVIDVSGDNGGGNIRIGGDYQGKNAAVPNALRTYLGPDAALRADAGSRGNGGRIIVWGDEVTRAYGSISARGGLVAGNGGFAEVSGLQGLVFEAAVDLRAPHGLIGTLLLDPDFIDIVNGGSDPVSAGDQFSDPSSFVSISPAALQAVGGNVMLQSNGDITFSDPVNLTTAGASLTALAGNAIRVDATITTNGGNITLHSAAPGSLGTGSSDSDAVYVGAALTSNGGTITLAGNSCDLFCDTVVLGANVNAGAGTVVINATGGDARQTAGAITAGSLFATADTAIDLNLSSNNISGDVSLTTNVSAFGSGLVLFHNSAAAFNLSGALSKDDITIAAAGIMTTDGSVQSTGGNVSITALQGLTLGDDLVAAGTVQLATGDTTLQQTGGAITAGGLTTVTTGIGAIVLSSSGNSFNGLSLSGGDIIAGAAGLLTVTSRSQAANSDLFLSGSGGLSLPAQAINVGTGQLVLSGGTAGVTTPAALSGAVVTLSASGSGNVTVAHNINASEVHLDALGTGNITQTAGSIVTPGLLVAAANGGGNITLNQAGNDFGQATLVGSVVSVTDATALSLSGVSVPTSFSLTTNGAITQSGVVSAAGTSTLSAGTNGAITLTNAGNNFGTVGLTGGVVQIADVNAVNLAASAAATSLSVQAAGNVTQTGALVVGGTTSISSAAGNVTLTTAGNNLNVLSVSGNAINVVEGAGSNLTVTSLFSGPNQPVSLSAGHTLTLPGAPINTGAADLTLSSGIGSLTIPAALNGRNISLSAVTGATVDAPINATGDFTATVSGGGSTLTVNRQVSAGADMTINLAGNLSVLASASGAAGLTAVGDQTINAGGNILLQGAASGSGNLASIVTTGSAGMQSITANGITLIGGGGLQNFVSIQAAGSQEVTVGNGGIAMSGGGGAQSGNYVEIEQLGPAGTHQLITVNGTGSISLQAGSAAGGDSEASIRSEFGDSQTITFTGGGGGRAITLVGGSVGADSYAEIWVGVGTQLITGAGLISLTGGDSGGGLSFGGGDVLGNLAAIAADSNDQTIIANGIALQGGLAGVNNFAGIFGGGDQSISVGTGGLFLAGGSGGASDLKNAAILWKGGDVPGTTQTITVGGGGTVTLQGGSTSRTNVGTDADFGGLSNGAFAAIRSEGAAQLIEFSAAGGSIQLTGGTVGSDNHAMITAQAGTQTIRGTSAANAPALVLSGGESGGVGGGANEGNRAMVFALAGNQAITARSISLEGGSAGNENLAQIRQGDTASGLASVQAIDVVGGGDILMQGGSGNTNFARIRAYGASQSISLGAGSVIDVTGGSGGVDSFAQIVAHNGDQSVTGADAIFLQGGSGGNNNRAHIIALLGSQTISVGAGGLTLTGGTGGVGELANFASVFQGGSTAKSQTITVSGGGDITLAAGSSASTGVGVDNGSLAYITSQGDSQLIEFSGAGSTLSITGGTIGSRNEAGVLSNFGTQTIRGTTVGNAPAILLEGGASGGLSGESNLAQIVANAGVQSITARSIGLQGGAGGTENIARIRQGSTTTGLASAQSITVTGGGALSLQGGGGTTNLADIRSHGPSQTIAFASGGSLSVSGGTGASLNYARVEALNGDQTISGSPAIVLTGGATGGAALAGNFASIQATNASAVQTIDSGSMTLNAGAGGTNNFAFVGAGVQDITVTGNLALNGGGSAGSATQGGGARIGAPGTAATDLLLDVTGNLTMTGGSLAGVVIGASVSGGSATDLDITVGGNVSLLPGAVSTAGARIGSPSLLLGGGNIRIDAGGSITLGTTGGGDTGVITAGNVALQGNTLSIADGVIGNQVELHGATGVSLSGFAAIAASGSGDALKIVVDSGAFSNTASANPLLAANGRWLVYSVNPANDTRGSLVHDFKQYDALPGDTVLGSGNGLLYSLAAPTATATLVGPVSKAYDGTDTATLSAGNYSATGIDGDVVVLNNPTTGTYDTKDVGTGKTVVVGGLLVVGATDASSKIVYGYNPVVSPASGLVGDISAATITGITGITALNKVYDTTTSATLVTGAAQFLGIVPGDTLLVSGATGAFLDENAGTGKTVNVTGLSLGGTSASNYVLTATTATTTADITPAPISAVTGITAAAKVYDGTTTATLTTSGAAFTGRLGSDVLTVATAVGNFSDKNVANPKTVNITGLSLGGTDASNYTLVTTTATTAAAITPATISAVGGITASKVYDGSTSGSAVLSGATLTGAVVGDNLSLNASAASFSDKNVGTGKVVTATGLSLGGTDAGNYTLVPSSATGTGTITQRAVSTWTGGGNDGLWSNPLNWDALPDGGNVATASIPAGAGTVIFDGAVPSTSLQTLSALSPFTMGGSSLSIGSTLAVEDFGQSGGALSGAGSLVVTNSFSQGGGSIAMGSVTIVQNAGNLSFTSLSGSTVNLIATAGAISQAGPLVAGTLITSSDTGTTLTHSGNQISNLYAENLGSGAITVASTGPLNVMGADNPGGNIAVSTNGVMATFGAVTAAGSVTLAATGSGGNLGIYAPVTGGNQVVLSTSGTLEQDAAVLGTNGVTADAGVSVVYRALATANYSPVVYRINGIVTNPPPTQTLLGSGAVDATEQPVDALVTFVALLQDAVNPDAIPEADDFNADGTRKKPTDDTIVTEGEVCN